MKLVAAAKVRRAQEVRATGSEISGIRDRLQQTVRSRSRRGGRRKRKRKRRLHQDEDGESEVEKEGEEEEKIESKKIIKAPLLGCAALAALLGDPRAHPRRPAAAREGGQPGHPPAGVAGSNSRRERSVNFTILRKVLFEDKTVYSTTFPSSNPSV